MSARVGKFELAHGGTLFLDEIGDMSLPLQAKLLRVLQSRSFERVGGRATIEVDVRVVAATNRDLEKAMAEEKFRQDLYYRLNVMTIPLPPLRERLEDIPLLVEHFLLKYNQEFGRHTTGISPEVAEVFRRYPWQGNVRELVNVLERAVILCPTETVQVTDLPVPLQDFAREHVGKLPAEGKASGGTRCGIASPVDRRFVAPAQAYPGPRRAGAGTETGRGRAGALPGQRCEGGARRRRQSGAVLSAHGTTRVAPAHAAQRLIYPVCRTCWFVVIALGIMPFALSANSQGSIERTFRFSRSDLTIGAQDGYVIPGLPNCEPVWTPGMPRLPICVCRILIPPGTRAKDVQVKTVSQEEVPGEYLVYPAQMPRPVSDREAPAFEPGDWQVYESDQPWPTFVAELQGTGEKCGYRIADVFVYPLRWTAAARRLELCTEVSVRVDYEDDGTGLPFRSARQLGATARELQMLVDNPEDISRFAPGGRATDPQDAEYVVVTSPALAPQFEPLLDWYRQLGLTAEGRTRDWIVANYPGLDVPERIRNFIIDYHANHGLTYVLLAGDTQIVPCRKGRATVPGYTDDLPTDLYYADLQWSWDGDHDGIWGEYGDDTVDFYADVYVGRAPVDDSAQAANFVNKVLGYERVPAPGYLARMLLPYTTLYATPYYSGRNAQDSITAFLPDEWQRASFTGMTNTGPIHDSIEAGFGLCHIVAHGNSTGCYTMGGVPIYNVATASSQTNGRKLPVLTSIACYSGNFEYNECLAEALMNNPSGGAVAVVMNSRYGIAQPPGCGPAEKLDIRCYDCLFRLDSFELGRAHSASRDFYAADGRSGGIWQWSLYELNLFGDPRMPVWTAEPELLMAEFPGRSTSGRRRWWCEPR